MWVGHWLTRSWLGDSNRWLRVCHRLAWLLHWDTWLLHWDSGLAWRAWSRVRGWGLRWRWWRARRRSLGWQRRDWRSSRLCWLWWDWSRALWGWYHRAVSWAVRNWGLSTVVDGRGRACWADLAVVDSLGLGLVLGLGVGDCRRCGRANSWSGGHRWRPRSALLWHRLLWHRRWRAWLRLLWHRCWRAWLRQGDDSLRRDSSLVRLVDRLGSRLRGIRSRLAGLWHIWRGRIASRWFWLWHVWWKRIRWVWCVRPGCRWMTGRWVWCVAWLVRRSGLVRWLRFV